MWVERGEEHKELYGFQRNLEENNKKQTELAGFENNTFHSPSLQRAKEPQDKKKPRGKDKRPGVARETWPTSKGEHGTINTCINTSGTSRWWPHRAFKTDKRPSKDRKGIGANFLCSTIGLLRILCVRAGPLGLKQI